MKKIISLLSIVCMLVSFNTYSQINVTVNSSECNQVGNIVVIPVTATIPANTDPLIALQGAISFSNPNIININGVTFTPAAFTSVQGNNVVGNLINFTFERAPVALAQTVTLFNINVPLIASGCTDVSFVSSNTAVIEFLTTSGTVAFTISAQGQLCDQPQIPNTVTANGEDITNTLTATMCRENGSIFIQADGDFVEGITYNTTSNVLNNLNGTFTLPINSTLTSFIVDINGINTCGNPNIIPVTVNVEDCSSPCDCIFSQGEIGGNSTIGCGAEEFGIVGVGITCNGFPGSPITWNFGDDSEEEITPFSFTEGILHTFGQEGIYTITASLEYTDPGSGEVCILSYEKTVEVINCSDPAELDITLGCISGNAGDIVSLPIFISANSTTTLTKIQGTIEFSNPSVINFLGISDFLVSGGMAFTDEVSPGRITFLWDTPSNSSGYVVNESESTFFYVDIELVGDGCTQFELNEVGTTIEFIDSNDNLLNYTVLASCEVCSTDLGSPCDCINEETVFDSFISECTANVLIANLGLDSSCIISSQISWDFGDGPLQTTTHPMVSNQHVYQQNGIYPVTVSFDVQSFSTGEICTQTYQTTVQITDCVETCLDEPYIEPYWEFCASNNVCELENWPIRVLDVNGNPITLSDGVAFSWVSSNGDTSSSDVVETVPGLDWTLTLTYPDGCIYIITYSQDCCNANIHLEIDECPNEEELELLTKYYISIYKELPTNIENALEYYKNVGIKECNPCEIGLVVLRVVHNNSNLVTNFQSIIWDDGFGQNQNIRLGDVNTEYGVTVIQDTETGICEYTDTILHPCRIIPPSCKLTTPQNLGCNFDGANFNLTWDEVDGAEGGYKLFLTPSDCDCFQQSLGVIIETESNSHTLSEAMSERCYRWSVRAICSENSESPSAEACFDPRECDIFGKSKEKSLELKTYPNPNNGEFSVTLNESIESFTTEICDFVGNQIFRGEYNKTNTFEVNLKGKPSGIYFVKVITEEGTFMEKVIIE